MDIEKIRKAILDACVFVPADIEEQLMQAEKSLALLSASPGERDGEVCCKDAERYQILTADLRGPLKDRRNSILFRMAVMGKGAADADIDLLIEQAESDSEQP